jgi:hypothetical protein
MATRREQGTIKKKPTADCEGKTNYKVSGQVHWFGNCAKGGEVPAATRVLPWCSCVRPGGIAAAPPPAALTGRAPCRRLLDVHQRGAGQGRF